METKLFFNGSYLEEHEVGEDKALPDAVNVVGRGDIGDPTGIGRLDSEPLPNGAPGSDPTVRPQSVDQFLSAGAQGAPSTADGPLVETEQEKLSVTSSGADVNNPQATGASTRAAQQDDPNVLGTAANKAAKAAEKGIDNPKAK